MPFARTRALSLATLAFVSAAVLVFGPVSAASAATDNSRSTLYSYVNSDRSSDRKNKFRQNSYLNDYAQAWAAKLAKANDGEGSTVTPPSNPLPPTDEWGNQPDLLDVQCVDRRSTGIIQDMGIRFCLTNDYGYATAPNSYNYMGIGVVETSTTSFVVMVLAVYPDGAASKLISAKPTIYGSGRVGEKLTAQEGAWSPTTGLTFTYNWTVAGDSVASTRTFVPRAEDLGKNVTVTVTGTKSGYWSPSNPQSSLRKVVTAGVIKPGTIAISGERNVGQTLNASAVGWSPASASISYQWLRAGVVITGEATSSYTLTDADLSTGVHVRVTASAPSYSTTSLTSGSTYLTGLPVLTERPTPTISGEPVFGNTLSAVAGDWQPADVGLTYRWNIAGVPVRGAVAPTFVVPATALGKVVTVTVTGSKEGFASSARTSAGTTAVVGRSFDSVIAPTISGSTLAGRTLTAATPAWTPTATVTYRWYRNGVAISGATASSYRTTSVDRGKSISVRAAGRKLGFITTTIFSAPVVIR